MPRRLPPLNALRAFDAAARHLSFTAAADELCVTHGAVSRQVKALEDALGVALFRRLNRRVALTEAGAGLLPAVRTAFDLLEASVARLAASRRQGPLTVSCLATFTMRWLIPRLHGFHARHPAIEVRLSASDAPVDFARDGIDLAIRVGAPPWPEGCRATGFIEEKVGPVCSPALLQGRKPGRPRDLARFTLLHTRTRPGAWAAWLRQTGAEGIDPTTGRTFEHFYFLLQAAASGLGVAIGPHPLVADDLASGRLVAPFGFVPSGNVYAMLCPEAATDLPKVVAFRDWIMAEAARDAAAPLRPPRASRRRSAKTRSVP